MRTRHDLPIAWRLGAGFLAVVAVMVAFGVFMLGSYQRGADIQRALTTHHVPLDDAGDVLERSLLYVGISLRSYIVQADAASRRAMLERIDQAQAALTRVRDAAGGSERDRALAARAVPLVESYLARVRGIASAGLSLDAATEVELSAAREAALARVRALTDDQHAQRADAIAAMERNRTRLAWAGVIAFVLVLCILAFVSFYTMRSIQRPTSELVRIASAMRGGDWKPALEWSPQAVAERGERQNPRSELARIAQAFGAAAVALDRREARLRADAQVAAATASSLRKDALAEAVLRAVVEGSGAGNAVFYVNDEAGLVPIAQRGAAPADALAFAGRTLREGEIFRDEPAAAAIALVFRDDALGAIALDAAKPFDADAREFLRAAAAQVAIGLANVIAHEEAQFLAEEVQARNEEIQAQMEEIQTQSEQLQAQNEELHAQSEQIADTNDRLQRQADELTHADERKNEFLALLAHELRNPLAAISNSIFMLLHPQVQPRQAEQARAVIDRQMRHLTRMIDDLLDVTRVSRGKLRLQRESLDLAQVVREAVEDQRGAIENSGLALEVQVPDRHTRVLGDRMRLGQVFSNLLHNACKFTPAGGGVTVRLEVEPDGCRAAVHVSDTGVGIPANLLDQLFQPFSQGEEPHVRANAGLGLGLALARALIQMHGGEIRARSAGPGAGAEFTVTLPLEGAARASSDARTFVDAGRRDGIVSEDLGDAQG